MLGILHSVCPWCRYEKLATLEFDRDRKSMSVIASTGAPADSGVRTRRSAAQPSNLLLVKGAAECVLDRCTEVRS